MLGVLSFSAECHVGPGSDKLSAAHIINYKGFAENIRPARLQGVRYQVQITRQADYAIRAVLYLARQSSGQRVATAKIADEQQIPIPFLAKIVGQLTAAGVLRATRGVGGGVALARPADEISMLDVIQAVDGPIAVNQCIQSGSNCSRMETCEVHSVWNEIQSDLVQHLAAVSFAQLIHRA